jgi:hypothetical protein
MCHATVSRRWTFAIVVERWAALANELGIASSRYANATCARALPEHAVKVVARSVQRLRVAPMITRTDGCAESVAEPLNSS